MAGYMRVLNGYAYDGTHKAGEALANGLFVEITSTGVKKITATKDAVLRVEEKTTLFGLPALVLQCVTPGANEVYFTENDWDVTDLGADYDEANYVIKSGEYVKMHRPVINDELIVTVSSTVYAALSVGDTVNPANGGTVAKVTD